MSLVISRNIVLSNEIVESGDKPVIGWQNFVSFNNITADTADINFPAINLANPQTFSRWQASDTSEQFVTFVTGTVDDLDYIAIARHNLASAAIPISIEGQLAGGGWFELVPDSVLPDDGPALFRFAAQPLKQIRIRLQTGSSPATIAVVYFGKLLVMERKIYVGQTPFPLGRMSKVTNGRSESGEYLGRIVLSEWTQARVPLSLLSPAWYRANMVPFLAAARNSPFFFAWRPATYPKEVGYAWLSTDPVPVNEGPSGLISMSLDLSGVT